MATKGVIRPPDVVTIRTRRDVHGVLRINGVCVIGSAAPCTPFLVVGRRVGPAVRCLLRNGFILICVSRNVLVLRRRRIVIKK